MAWEDGGVVWRVEAWRGRVETWPGRVWAWSGRVEAWPGSRDEPPSFWTNQEANLLKPGGRSQGRNLRRPEVPQTWGGQGGGSGGSFFSLTLCLFLLHRLGKPENQPEQRLLEQRGSVCGSEVKSAIKPFICQVLKFIYLILEVFHPLNSTKTLKTAEDEMNFPPEEGAKEQKCTSWQPTKLYR